MSKRAYKGDPLDCTYQNITERPELEDSDVVYVTDPEGQGKETTENVPIPGEKDEPVRIPGQSTLSEFEGGSSE